ncbi:MAG: CotH kinase family protein [Oscillospiraceae bacterium]|nr:CotH kinase family protein [Oscillospiraceae bacterium]
MKSGKKILSCLAAAFMLLQNPVPKASAEKAMLYARTQDLIRTEAVRAQAEPEPVPDPKYETIPLADLRVKGVFPGEDHVSDAVDVWYCPWEDCRYLFLPSTANREELYVTYDSKYRLFLNETQVTSGKLTSLLSTADTFQMRVGDKECGTLKVMQSNLGCISLRAQDMPLDQLNSSRRKTASGSALMVNAEGETVYDDAFEKLWAHGNSSWDYSKKKPYNLKLPKKADLFGMGKAKRWVLLSNYLDHSMLRNRMAEEMAKSAGMEFVPDTVFADLYYNGSYCGTYQLSEKVQIQKNRVNIRDLADETEELNSSDLSEYPENVIGAESRSQYMENSYKFYDILKNPADITGGYLLQFEQWNRYGIGGKAKSGFVTSRGQAITVKDPEYASQAQVEYIRAFVQEAEDAMYSETGYNEKGRHFSEYIDMESFVEAYLMQEITMNIDATFSSFYFWKDSDLTGDGKLHFGPPWDFDLSCNNFPTTRINEDGIVGYSYRPDNLFAARFPIHGYDDNKRTSSSGSGRPTVGYSWIAQLYRQEDFVHEAAETYFRKFRPYLLSLTDEKDPYFMQLAAQIQPSAEMSNARWHTYGGSKYTVFGSSSGEDFIGSVAILSDFVTKRADWLSELWEPYRYLEGDANGDGELNAADAVALQKWLLCYPDAALANRQSADFSRDYRIDSVDFTLLKRSLTGT